MIITVTPSPTIDISVEVDRLVPEHKLRSHLTAFQPGGGGVNVARVLHDLGVTTRAIVAVGGAPGDVVLSRLLESGVDVVPVRIAASTRWVEMLREHDTDSEFRLVTEAPTLTEREWRALVAAVDVHGNDANAVVLSGGVPPSVPVEFVHELAAVCRRRGAQFVVDTSGPPLAAAVSVSPFLLKPSLRELASLEGVDIGAVDPMASARALVSRGVGAVVVSLGSDGALVATEERSAWLRPPEIPMVSTVGAGDTLLAGILAGIVAGSPMVEACRSGVALATATCLSAPGIAALTADTERLAAQTRVETLI